MDRVMSPAEAERRDRLLAAMERIAEVGLLMPSLESFEQALADDDEATLSTVEVVLAEMEKIKAEVEAVMVEQERAMR